MKTAILLFGFAGMAFAARLEPVRPSASAGLMGSQLLPQWFEPNAGQVKGRTEFAGRTRGAYLYMTGREVVFAMAPAKVEFGAKMRQVRMRFEGASAKPAGAGEQPTGNPVVKGSVIVFYATGGGELSGDRLALPVKVFVDGIESEVLYAGIAPGLASGALQINFRVPERASKGGVVLHVGGRESQEGVFIVLRN